MKTLILASAVLALVGVSAPASAQIHHREHTQEQRIRQGEMTGRLTPAEARRLQFLEMRLHRTEARMRANNGGRLSSWQRHRLQQMANRDSAAIYRLKHNRRGY